VVFAITRAFLRVPTGGQRPGLVTAAGGAARPASYQHHRRAKGGVVGRRDSWLDRVHDQTRGRRADRSSADIAQGGEAPAGSPRLFDRGGKPAWRRRRTGDPLRDHGTGRQTTAAKQERPRPTRRREVKRKHLSITSRSAYWNGWWTRACDIEVTVAGRGGAGRQARTSVADRLAHYRVRLALRARTRSSIVFRSGARPARRWLFSCHRRAAGTHVSKRQYSSIDCRSM